MCLHQDVLTAKVCKHQVSPSADVLPVPRDVNDGPGIDASLRGSQLDIAALSILRANVPPD